MSIFDAVKSTKQLNTIKYREWYHKERKPKFYNPFLHLGFNVGVLVLLIVGHFLMVKDWRIESLLVMGFIFLFGNFAVWFLHRYPLHRRYKYWSFPYDAHTIEHHRYFTSDLITYDSFDDYVAIFFPTFVIAGFALVGQPVFYYGSRMLLGTDLAHVFSGSAAGYFLMYEFFHWASHLPKDHLLVKIPWINYMRKHHLAHHNTRLMNRYNFCIVYPMMDIIMGTKYKGEMPAEKVEDHFEDVQLYFKEQ